MKAAHEAVAKVIEVDDFAPEVLSPIYRKATHATPDRAAN
jgi:acyl-CoA dehydrogenase